MGVRANLKRIGRKVAGAVGGAVSNKSRRGKKAGTGKHRKKSALWYAKNIQRVKLKRKYEKLMLGLGR